MIQKQRSKLISKALFLFRMMMLIALTSCASGKSSYKSLSYTPDLFAKVDFVKHDEYGTMKSYLALNVNFVPVKELRQRLETEIANELKSRPEAHITVITPMEYDKVLAKKIKMREINALADKLKIQDSSFKPICIGKGSAQSNGDTADTYFVVVSTDALFHLRAEVQKLFISKGGLAADFNPENFYPHITLGFTQRDLHFDDGIVKDERSCLYRLHE